MAANQLLELPGKTVCNWALLKVNLMRRIKKNCFAVCKWIMRGSRSYFLKTEMADSLTLSMRTFEKNHILTDLWTTMEMNWCQLRTALEPLWVFSLWMRLSLVPKSKTTEISRYGCMAMKETRATRGSINLSSACLDSMARSIFGNSFKQDWEILSFHQ